MGDGDDLFLLEAADSRNDVLLCSLNVTHTHVVQVLDICLKALSCTRGNVGEYALRNFLGGTLDSNSEILRVNLLCELLDSHGIQVDDILEYAESRGEAPFVVVLDEVEDPHNLGAIIRTAECAGVHGIIIPKRRSAGLSYTVAKASAGAIEYMRVARVTNIAVTLDELKEKGVWVYGADMDGTDYDECDFSGACAIVIGNEGKGISRLVREKCDVIASLPMKGQINSLNASVAAGILMYKAMKNR